MFQTAAIFFGGYSHTAYHPFDDVAVVAKQSAWLAVVVAMVGAYLAAFKAPLAYCALVALFIYQAIDYGLRHAGSTVALMLKNGRPSVGIVAVLGVCLRMIAFISGAALLANLWNGIALGARRLNGRVRTLGFTLLAYSVTVLMVVSNLAGFVCLPLIRCAFGLFHTIIPRAELRVV